MSEISLVSDGNVSQATPLEAKSVAEFVAVNRTRYETVFEKLDASRLAGNFNATAALAGPVWAAWRGLWPSFYILTVLDLLFLVLGISFWQADPSGSAPLLWAGLIVVSHLAFGVYADRIYRAQYHRWRVRPSTPAGISTARAAFGAALIAVTYTLVVYRIVATDPVSFLTTFPMQSGLLEATTATIDNLVSWMTVTFGQFFDALTAFMRSALTAIETIFVKTPWPVVGGAITLLGYYRGGPRLAILTAAALAYIGIFGLWEMSMATVALVATSVLVCVAIGIPLGLLCARNKRANAILEPLLDVMQTLPTFVYLIPAIAFFSIGKPPGLIATIVFASPPVIRLTALGIRQVPTSIREAAEAYGATPFQLLLKVEFPLATPSIQMGINQTIMMSLSMVVIAAMIGAGGLGQQVIRSLQYLQTGQGFLAGLAIVLVAMVLDRMVRSR